MILFSGLLILLGVLGMTRKSLNSDRGYNHPLDPLFIAAAKKHGVNNWLWLKAIAKQESDLGNDPRVKSGQVSYDGKSYGLMQIAPGIGSANEILIKGPKNIGNLNIDEYSIDKAAMLVRYLQDKYNGDIRRIFRAYNQGERNEDLGKDYTVKYTPGGYDNAVIKHLERFEREEFER